MEKVQLNSINKTQNGLNSQKVKNHPPSPAITIIILVTITLLIQSLHSLRWSLCLGR